MATTPVLRCLELTVWKNKSGTSPPEQIPAAATVDFYKQGATVREGITVPPTDPSDPEGTSTDVRVWHRGSIQYADDLQADVNLGKLMRVVYLDDTTPDIITVINLSFTTPIFLTADQRLLRLTDRPPTYTNPVASGGGASTRTTDPTTGRLGCYVPEYRYDFFVHGAGVISRIHRDAEGSYVMRA